MNFTSGVAIPSGPRLSWSNIRHAQATIVVIRIRSLIAIQTSVAETRLSGTESAQLAFPAVADFPPRSLVVLLDAHDFHNCATKKRLTFRSAFRHAAHQADLRICVFRQGQVFGDREST